MQKSEALRRVFDRVTLFWAATWRPSTNPRKKTERAGRFSYSLDTARTEWAFPKSNLDASCCTGTCSRSGR